MRFGVCGNIKNISRIKSAGYDYHEWYLYVMMALSDNQYNEAKAQYKEAGLTPECFAGFFPQGTRLTGEVIFEYIEEYAELALSRAAGLGGKIAVLGNGGLRKTPEGFDKATALAQFKQVAKICGDAAARHGMKIAIEPLNEDETDLINTVAEGLALCKDLNHPNVGLLVDFYHVFKTGETLDAIENAGDWLIHAHIARPDPSRRAPCESDLEVCKKWAAALKKCGYNGRLSLECHHSEDYEGDLNSMMKMTEVFK